MGKLMKTKLFNDFKDICKVVQEDVKLGQLNMKLPRENVFAPDGNECGSVVKLIHIKQLDPIIFLAKREDGKIIEIYEEEIDSILEKVQEL